jgi:hypothetical protein
MSRTFLRLTFMLIPAIFLASIAVAQAPRTTPADDDDDDVALIGRQTFVENCLICHGEEMAANQRLTTKQWTAEVDKMVGWGSPVPPDKKSSLLTYLTTSFSDHAAAPRPDTAAATDLIRVEVPPPTHVVSRRRLARRPALHPALRHLPRPDRARWRPRPEPGRAVDSLEGSDLSRNHPQRSPSDARLRRCPQTRRRSRPPRLAPHAPDAVISVPNPRLGPTWRLHYQFGPNALPDRPAALDCYPARRVSP